MTQSIETQLISDIARDLVAQIAPQELPLFRPIKEAYFKDPEKARKGTAAKDEMLGFGVADAAMLITPIVLTVVTDVVKHITEQVLETVKQEGAMLATDIVKKLFKKLRTPTENEEEIPLITDEQRSDIYQLAFKQAYQLNLPEDQAKALAASIIDLLVIGKKPSE
jgi:hypothetical protein